MHDINISSRVFSYRPYENGKRRRFLIDHHERSIYMHITYASTGGAVGRFPNAHCLSRV